MHIIIGIPPHIIIMGAPMAIIDCMASQRSFMRGIIDGSVGIIFIIMPSLVISHDIVHIIGMGIIMPIMPPPMGIGIDIGIMPIICGIIMPFIIGIMLFIGIIEPGIIGMVAFMAVSSIRSDRTLILGRPPPEASGARGASFRLP